MIALLNFVLYTVHIIVSLFLVLVVLLQQGKGADLSVFGGGASQAAFGARGAATVLHKATVIGFILFIFTTLTIGVVQSRSETTVMSGVETSAPDESEELTAPAGGELSAPAGGELPAEGDATVDEAEPAAEGAAAPAEAPEDSEGSEDAGEAPEGEAASSEG